MKGKFLAFPILMLAVVAFALLSCKGGETQATIVENTETLVAIRIEETDGEADLLAAMKLLKEQGALTFESSSGMVTSINGKANAADYSGCWMLYTSDTEMSNAAWGTIEYDGKTLGSALLGADGLRVVKGEYYVWAYQTF